MGKQVLYSDVVLVVDGHPKQSWPVTTGDNIDDIIALANHVGNVYKTIALQNGNGIPSVKVGRVLYDYDMRQDTIDFDFRKSQQGSAPTPTGPMVVAS